MQTGKGVGVLSHPSSCKKGDRPTELSCSMVRFQGSTLAPERVRDMPRILKRSASQRSNPGDRAVTPPLRDSSLPSSPSRSRSPRRPSMGARDQTRRLSHGRAHRQLPCAAPHPNRPRLSFWSRRRFHRQTPDCPAAIRPAASAIAGVRRLCRRDPALRRAATFFERQLEITKPRP